MKRRTKSSIHTNTLFSVPHERHFCFNKQYTPQRICKNVGKSKNKDRRDGQATTRSPCNDCEGCQDSIETPKDYGLQEPSRTLVPRFFVVVIRFGSRSFLMKFSRSIGVRAFKGQTSRSFDCFYVVSRVVFLGGVRRRKQGCFFVVRRHGGSELNFNRTFLLLVARIE